MSNRLNQKREERLQPLRMQCAISAIEAKGYRVIIFSQNYIKFQFNGNTVTFWPYSGWASGKSIKDGRGLKNLLEQIK